MYWPNCILDCKDAKFNGEDALFLECNPEEVKEQLFDLLTENQIELCLRKYNPCPDPMQLEFGIETNKICFLITKNRKVILPCSWYFPYSGQWNAYNPFRKIKEIEIKDINELSDIIVKVEVNNFKSYRTD